MTKYKKFSSKQGERYMAGGRITSEAYLAPSVRRRLDELPIGTVYDDSPEEATPVQPPGRDCVFCGEHGTRRRYVHLQMVYLCESHYQNKTIGEVGQVIKELSDGKEEKV